MSIEPIVVTLGVGVVVGKAGIIPGWKIIWDQIYEPWGRLPPMVVGISQNEGANSVKIASLAG